MTEKTREQLNQELAEAQHRIAELEALLAEKTATDTADNDRRMLQTIMDNLPAGVFVVQVPSGKPILANQQAQNLLGKGIDPEATSKDELAEVYAAYRYGTEELYPVNEMPLVRGMGGEKSMIDDMEIRKPDGKRLLLQVFGAPIRDTAGEIISSVAIFQDVTEYRQAQEALAESERKFRTLLEFASEGMIVVNEAGQIVLVNSSVEEMFGYHRDELLGQAIELLVPGRFREGHREHRANFVTTTERRPMGIGLELMALHQDGSEFPVEISLSSIQTKTGYLTMSYIVDVTEKKQLQAEHDKLQEDIIEAQQRTIQELSTPIIPVIAGIIVMPLIGSIDSLRARDIMRNLLAGINDYQAKIVILDITGVPIVDTGVVANLDRTIQAARLKGCRTIVTGISDAVAETLVDLGIDWSQVETLRNLQTGLMVALNNLGFKLVENTKSN